MYELTDQIFEAIFALDEDYRKFFCLNNCETHNVIYVLKGTDGSPLMLEDHPEEGEEAGTFHTILPIWCHDRYAQYYLEHSFEGDKSEYHVAELTLDLFKKSWVPVLLESKIALAFMPLEQDKMFCIESADILLKTPEERKQASEAAQKDEAEEVKKELKAMEKAQH